MMSISYIAGFGLGTKQIEIAQVAGAGGEATWHIFVNGFLWAIAHEVGNEIRVRPTPKAEMDGGDIVALIDVLNDLPR